LPGDLTLDRREEMLPLLRSTAHRGRGGAPAAFRPYGFRDNRRAGPSCEQKPEHPQVDEDRLAKGHRPRCYLAGAPRHSSGRRTTGGQGSDSTAVVPDERTDRVWRRGWRSTPLPGEAITPRHGPEGRKEHTDIEADDTITGPHGVTSPGAGRRGRGRGRGAATCGRAGGENHSRCAISTRPGLGRDRADWSRAEATSTYSPRCGHGGFRADVEAFDAGPSAHFEVVGTRFYNNAG